MGSEAEGRRGRGENSRISDQSWVTSSPNLHSTVLGQSAWQRLERLSKLLYRVLLHPRARLHSGNKRKQHKSDQHQLQRRPDRPPYLCERGQLFGDLDLGCTCPGDKPSILGESFEGVDSIIHSPFHVVHDVLGRPSHDHCGNTTALLL